ncbi:42609_t:CDS:2 [Gigaspora margarita]|uniref:42609_t:CDS:1 n=1 Tax=Gigaspora margarita TaxID=4874 RepID=A0ABN7UXG2_GIGMA|nr:42609_t:CDS:2 [Gigaspora margarita]
MSPLQNNKLSQLEKSIMYCALDHPLGQYRIELYLTILIICRCNSSTKYKFHTIKLENFSNKATNLSTITLYKPEENFKLPMS